MTIIEERSEAQQILPKNSQLRVEGEVPSLAGATRLLRDGWDAVSLRSSN
jgi:hypothetical protein